MVVTSYFTDLGRLLPGSAPHYDTTFTDKKYRPTLARACVYLSWSFGPLRNALGPWRYTMLSLSLRTACPKQSQKDHPRSGPSQSRRSGVSSVAVRRRHAPDCAVSRRPRYRRTYVGPTSTDVVPTVWAGSRAAISDAQFAVESGFRSSRHLRRHASRALAGRRHGPRPCVVLRFGGSLCDPHRDYPASGGPDGPPAVGRRIGGSRSAPTSRRRRTTASHAHPDGALLLDLNDPVPLRDSDGESTVPQSGRKGFASRTAGSATRPPRPGAVGPTLGALPAGPLCLLPRLATVPVDPVSGAPTPRSTAGTGHRPASSSPQWFGSSPLPPAWDRAEAVLRSAWRKPMWDPVARPVRRIRGGSLRE